MRYRITAPVKGATCTVAGVAFVDSVAETDSEGAVAYFRRHGYAVEETEQPADERPRRGRKTQAKPETKQPDESPKEGDQ